MVSLVMWQWYVECCGNILFFCMSAARKIIVAATGELYRSIRRTKKTLYQIHVGHYNINDTMSDSATLHNQPKENQFCSIPFWLFFVSGCRVGTSFSFSQCILRIFLALIYPQQWKE